MRLLFVALLFAAACSHKPPDEKLLDDVEPAASWAASLQLIGEKWLANSVPAAFVKNSADAARKSIEKTAKQIDQSQASADLRQALRRDAVEVMQAAEQLEAAVDKGDRSGVERATKRLEATAKDFEERKR